jgi:hypothetical protein
MDEKRKGEIAYQLLKSKLRREIYIKQCSSFQRELRDLAELGSIPLLYPDSIVKSLQQKILNETPHFIEAIVKELYLAEANRIPLAEFLEFIQPLLQEISGEISRSTDSAEKTSEKTSRRSRL